MRAVCFVFYLIETVFNIFCMAFHIRGFMSVDLSGLGWQKQIFHYFYLVVFYLCTVLTLFQSINVCTGHTPHLYMEIWKTGVSSFTFIAVSAMTMWDAEKDFHLMYLSDDDDYSDDPVHPFFTYMRGQSVASLACGVLYMLHTCILVDIWLTGYGDGVPASDRLVEENMPIKLYVFGEYMQAKLDSHKWFQDFRDEKQMNL